MALEGTLRDFSLADIFQLIGIQKKTGVLTLKNGEDVVTVSFLNGSVVSADSLNKNLEDRLGTVLVKSGRISQARLQEALRIQKETLQQLGYLLVHGEFIGEEDLREALRLQITQIVYRLFRWNDGDYHFSQEESVEYDRKYFAPLSAENILMEGIRMIDEWPVIERKIRSFDMVFRKTDADAIPRILQDKDDDIDGSLEAALSGPGRSVSGSEPTPQPEGPRMRADEAAVYTLIDGLRSVQEIIDRSRMGEFETCRILYDLMSRGMIASVETVAPLPVPRSRTWVGPLLEKAGYVLLGAAVLISVTTISESPMAGAPRHLAPEGSIDRIHDLIARNRLQRLDGAVGVYYLQKGFYPDDLKDLVQGRLVPPESLKDPWGRTFGFISTRAGYRLIAYDEGGIENPHRTLVRHRVRLHQAPPDPPAEPSAQLGPAAAVTASTPAP